MIGLRQHEIYAEDHGHSQVYDNWRLEILRRCLPDSYDEERRLLYMATIRAKNHVVYAGRDSPNTFLEELDVTIESTNQHYQRRLGLHMNRQPSVPLFLHQMVQSVRLPTR
ncbi:hypothetical protein BV210_05010 [Halorientalis sp. IM1011]|nr:hypothetical protein BV210_05010 [Halorientalis sp. IM1011]